MKGMGEKGWTRWGEPEHPLLDTAYPQTHHPRKGQPVTGYRRDASLQGPPRHRLLPVPFPMLRIPSWTSLTWTSWEPGMASKLATLVSLAKNCWASCSKPAPRSHSRSSRTLARSFTPWDQWKQPREDPAGAEHPSAHVGEQAPSPFPRERAAPRQQNKSQLMSPASYSCNFWWWLDPTWHSQAMGCCVNEG